MTRLNRLLELLDRRRSGSGSTERTVAIACQGGGSHAAFTAGVLDELLGEFPSSHRLVGLSGASGGAVSAVAAWYGLLAAGETSGSVLEAVWDDIAANTPWDRWVNGMAVLGATVPASVEPAENPYLNPGSDLGRAHLERTLQEHVDFTSFGELVDLRRAPALLVSAVNVRTGSPQLFRDDEITPATVVASSAIPRVFEPVDIDGEQYWDGFLSQNPPIREFVTDGTIPAPDELWIVRLTPETVEEMPTTAEAIDGRVRQLVETLSLRQERRFVETVNEWIADGRLADPSLTETTIRHIDLPRERAGRSQLDRRPSFVADLYGDGEDAARAFRRQLA
ncbi:Alpha-beta superfamily hydrolase, patatin/cPLA2 family [Halorhabdus sp. SVX81]|uniref:patatin-like phospholipase family protein n=1 Tax=Halorhabdus sp. SVX81 TaxID=2978283 RepID=UPI0023DC51A1|nr:patatin-like phospholipase family protein [Halorhabdus sp. SVX81]WEL17397.1 Alpha-beta superfamily hydrolase, patatin/cPLA2 family [Halorhabdus sp. SVX81]